MVQGVDKDDLSLLYVPAISHKPWLFSSDERRTTLHKRRTMKTAEYHSRRDDARRFPVDESDDGTSVESARIIHEDFNCNRRYARWRRT